MNEEQKHLTLVFEAFTTRIMNNNDYDDEAIEEETGYTQEAVERARQTLIALTTE